MHPRTNTALLLAFALSLSFCLSACYSTTRIYSRPAGAEAVLDHEKRLGETPIELEEQVWLWTSHSVTLTKAGYEPRSIQIRNQGVNFAYLAVCVCTLGLLLPIMFVSEYPSQYVVELLPELPRSDAGALTEEATVSFRE